MNYSTQTCDSNSHLLQIISWSITAFGVIGWSLSALLFWRKIAAERRAAAQAAQAAILPVTHPVTDPATHPVTDPVTLPVTHPVTHRERALHTTVTAINIILSSATDCGVAATQIVSANAATAVELLTDAADSATCAAAMLSAAAATITATTPFPVLTALNAAFSKYSPGGRVTNE